MAGGNSGGITSFLPIAAALAATVATDGAASPWLVDAMGATAAGALTSGAAAAAASGITASLTGQNVGRAAIMGGIGGGVGGALGTTALGSEGVAGATTAPLTGANVAGTAAYLPSGGGAFVPTAGSGASFAIPEGLGATAAFTPSEYASQYAAQDLENGLNAGTGTASTSTAPPPGSNGIMKLLSDNRGIAALGGTALLGTLMNQSNKKYGTPTAASQEYNGPLNDFHYSRENYTPLTVAQPSPAYKPVYPNYVKNPYNAYAAAGGRVVSMAEGGIAGAGQSNDGSSPMFDTNGVAQNQIYPQSTINSDAFSNATNVPVAQNIVSGISDANVDPYTGAERFAEGGITDTPQTQPQGVPLQAMPNMLTQNAMANNNNLTQDLISRMAARNAMNPMPGQTPPVAPMQPAGIMAAAPQTQYQGYAAPTFTRPTNVAPIEFQNPKAIVGTKAYNDEQARLAAEEQARQAAMFTSSGGGGAGNGDGGGGGEAAGGLMQSYSGGGKATNNMGAIDDYVTQYQTDPASVTAKAKAGDWNAMIAMNKINSTPNKNYAAGGGIGHLGGYAAGGNPHLLKGPGDGMSDNIPATIGGKQPARLADGEFVVPADVVSHLGNGSTDAGAKHLYAMMDKVRKARTGNKKQGKQIKAAKYLKA